MSTSLERYVQGTEKVLENLNKEIANIGGRISEEGMWECLLLVEGKAKRITPVGPSKAAQKEIFKSTGRVVSHIGTGNLRSSYSTYVYNTSEAIEGILVNSALYALYVHEMPESYHFTKPGTGPKFVEKPLFQSQDEILNILMYSAQIL